ncbi:MAG TPA: GNAT family N-acetyltransferase [Micromonosporaceae bacterium]|nr:GNAT family N-acetyltransferase [Micromonosporaceae bacterium]
MAIIMRLADPGDLAFLDRADPHVSEDELARVLRAGRVIVADDGTSVRGWLRWGLFWDAIPFMNMLFVVEPHRGRGLGTRLIAYWEDQQRAAGFHSVMTSTLATERAQHLFRRRGYIDRGCLLLPGEPLEILLGKPL